MQTGLQKVNVVTGAHGFLGRWLVLELLQQGHPVLALMRKHRERDPSLRAWLEARGADTTRLTTAHFDLEQPEPLGLTTKSIEQLREARAVYHLAALFAFGLPLERARKANVVASERLVELLADAPIERLIHISGYRTESRAAALLDLDDPQSLRRFYRHHGAYEASKLEAHQRVARAADQHNVPLTRISPAVVIGDSRNGETIQRTGIAETIDLMREGKFHAMTATPQTPLPLLTVDFLARLLTRLPDDPESLDQNIVLFDPDSPTFHQLLARCADHMGVTLPRLHIPLWLLRKLPRFLTGLEPEALLFLDEDDYNPQPARELSQRLEIPFPDLQRSLERWLDYLAVQAQPQTHAQPAPA